MKILRKYVRIGLLKTLLVGLLSISSFNSVSAQALYRGNFIVDAYYGFPNFGKTLMDLLYEDPAINIEGVGPWGVKLEYMLGEEFGITLNGIHNSAGSTHRVTYDKYDDDGQIYYETYYYRTRMDRLRVQFGMNYHFDFDNPLLDTYVGIAMGTNGRRIRYDFDNDPSYDGAELEETGVLLPVSMRLSAGGRYFFSDHIGINFEIGLGGPLMSFGLTAKF